MDFIVEVNTDNKRIIDSGTIVLLDDSVCSFKIKNGADIKDELKFKFVFENTDDGNRKFLTNIINNELILKCINFSSGTATRKALNIGFFEENGKKITIFVHFWYYKMSHDSPAKFDYTIYAEENNGF